MPRPPCAVHVAAAALAMLLAPTPAEAQNRLRLEVAPVVSAGGASGVVRRVQTDSSTRGVTMDTGRFLGLGLYLGLRDFPVGVRLGGSHARGALSYDAGVTEPSPQAGAPTPAEVLGSASIWSLWTDVLVEPFSWNVSPYGVVGAAYRRTSYAGLDEELITYFDGVDGELQIRLGIGADARLSRWSSFWVEVVRDFSPNLGQLGLDERQPQDPTSVLLGVRLRLF